MLQSGQALSGRFTLVRRLGAGGSAEVWLAQDREHGRLVAVKVLAAHLSRNEAAIAALARECEHVAALDHPSILRVDGLNRSGEHAWIVMEYASGGDLSSLRGRSCVEVLRAVIPIAGALAFAHERGIVHRDVKPSNVLRMSDGEPKLADFGMALALDALPAPDAGLGSKYSMSPQQAAGAPASVADDVYAFGAMLYELLSGYPPYYADGGAKRAQHPAPLPQSVPPALVRLIMQSLAESVADRPADMRTVERELTEVLATLPPPTIVNAVNERPVVNIEPPRVRPPGGQQGEPLRPQWNRSADRGREEGRGRRFGGALAAGGATLAVAGIVLVFFVLPRWVEQERPTLETPVTVLPPEPEQEKKEIDYAELARAKQRVEDLRGPIDERLQKLTARAAEQWGGEEYERVKSELAKADEEFEAREYVAAADRLATLDPLLTTLEQRAAEVLKRELQAGALALEQGRSEDARAAFELAAKIEPGNQVAARGLKRASTLDEVLGLLARAERLEKEGQKHEAIEEFRKALALDSEARRASEGIARIEAQLASDAFASAMARGFSALAQRDYSGARSAFEAARKIRPDAPEIAQALRQIEQEQRTGVIAAKLEAAREHESSERWADALKEYRAALELDPTVADAQEGVTRVTPRAQLNEQLELYLTQPERLFSQPVRAAAAQALERARAIPNPGPVLTRQVATLSEWLARAEVPVKVALESDNLTSVTIYRVGQLGTFSQRSLELVPGTYTVVGTRPGYRDVRRQIQVLPGATLEPIVIR
ncbi:MAG TPA: protein kinase, partial [Steroidobacteraceae bacterium]